MKGHFNLSMITQSIFEELLNIDKSVTIHRSVYMCLCVTLLTITHELYTKMFRDQKFQVSSCV